MARNWDTGDLIMGRYRLVSKLGQGGMGSVWRAEHIELKNQVAIKLLDPAISQNEEMIGRFLREARAAASLQNRHVIQIFDHGVEDGEAFMVMELLEGETIGERLEKGPMPVEDTIKFMIQVMRAMGKAHDIGIVHRDLKPDNIFITSDDEGEYAKVLDFGVAKVGGDLGSTNGVKTQTGMMLGTPFYMSPEQAKAKRVDARTDVWALAVITYECLTGKRPFTGESFADLVLTLCNAPIPIPSAIASVPVGFDEWFVHATQRDVDKRFRSARDMANELIQLANAPMTGKGFAGATHGYGRLGPVTTPPAGTPAGQQGRMSMTTGQSASVSRSSSHGSARSNNGVWIFATAAMVLVTAGVGAYAWKTSKLTDVSAPASSPDTSAEQPLEEEVEGESEAPAKKDATPSKDGVETRPSEQETEPAAPLPQERPPAPSKEQRTEKKHGAEKKPSTAPEEAKPVEKPATKDVPVVDKQALPPEEWNF